MAITLKHSTLDIGILSMVKASTSETAKRLSLLCYKLLCLVDLSIIRIRVNVVVRRILHFKTSTS
ncbi:BAP_1a_G0031130.mRNA.1.CDS.1 [Saccharomyces cerevisiae]|nr:BAP_1a_G0031130.mRNA.1.CDS.1 [Saccharomyces cerevisiae]CAI7191077.1 BAP_1a_G0031130.mRNA.1.CDS.1 [Saccharomyces cerevisiae]